MGALCRVGHRRQRRHDAAGEVDCVVGRPLNKFVHRPSAIVATIDDRRSTIAD
jgi:hypothetical protein